MQRSLDSSERFMGPKDILSLHLYLKDKAMAQVSIRIAIHVFEFFHKISCFFFGKIDLLYLAFSSPFSDQLVSSLEKCFFYLAFSSLIQFNQFEIGFYRKI